MLFDEATLRKLNTLTLVATQVRAGMLQGDRRSTKRGTSIEFADYRDYVPGDDLRRLDWNVYARLEKPFIKLFEEEEDLAVHILVDGSRSMDWGEEDTNKYDFARKLAGALGSIALSTGDRLTVSQLTDSGTGASYGPARGNFHTLRLFNFLETCKSGGETYLNRALRQYALTHRRAGLTFLLTDLLDPHGYESGFSDLLSRGHELVVLHLLAPEEADPALAGDLKLIDVEYGAEQEVSLDSGLRRLYVERVQAWQGEIRAWCRQRNIHYLNVTTNTPWDKVVLQQFRAQNLVK